MLFGCLGLLIAAGFVSDVPPLLESKLSTTNETRGAFVQTKIDGARTYEMHGTYRIRPGVDFEWATTEPFETRFYATPTNYVYSNEDESVARLLKEMPGSEHFAAISRGDPKLFFEAFDALYKEENGRFFVKAKPKVRDLKRVLERVEAEGTVTNWTLTATFPNGVKFKIDFKDE